MRAQRARIAPSVVPTRHHETFCGGTRRPDDTVYRTEPRPRLDGQITNAVMDAHVDLPMAPIELPGTTPVSGERVAPGGLEGEWSFDGTLDELNQHVNLDEWEDCV